MPITGSSDPFRMLLCFGRAESSAPAVHLRTKVAAFPCPKNLLLLLRAPRPSLRCLPPSVIPAGLAAQFPGCSSRSSGHPMTRSPDLEFPPPRFNPENKRLTPRHPGVTFIAPPPKTRTAQRHSRHCAYTSGSLHMLCAARSKTANHFTRYSPHKQENSHELSSGKSAWISYDAKRIKFPSSYYSAHAPLMHN